MNTCLRGKVQNQAKVAENTGFQFLATIVGLLRELDEQLRGWNV